MSRIDDLIKKHCPNGVVFKELQEIFFIKTGYTPSKANNSFWTDGTVPWFRMDDIRKNGRILSDSLQHITPEAVKSGKLFPANSILISTIATIGEHALITVPHLANQQIKSLSLKPVFDEQFDIRFLYYYCFVLGEWCLANTTKSSFFSVDMAGFKKFKFPVPPLEIQQKIVDILDKFTKLTVELTVELTARKKQYTYYRDQLLNFEGRDIEWKTLGNEDFFEVANRDRKPVESSLRISGKTPYYGANNIQDYVHGYTHEGEYVLIAEDGSASLKNYSIQYATGKFWANNHVHVVCGKPNLNTRFLYHYLSTVNFVPFLTGGGRAKLTKGKMIAMPIPVPPLAEQVRIVSILDKFDALTNSISEGLPREIELRQKQYVHYRDSLLSFPELEEATA